MSEKTYRERVMLIEASTPGSCRVQAGYIAGEADIALAAAQERIEALVAAVTGLLMFHPTDAALERAGHGNRYMDEAADAEEVARAALTLNQKDEQQ